MSLALRKIASHASKCGCTIIFINQLRNKVSTAVCYLGSAAKGCKGISSRQWELCVHTALAGADCNHGWPWQHMA